MLSQANSLLKSKRLPHGIIWVDDNPDDLASFIKSLTCQGKSSQQTHACGQCKTCLLTQSEAGHPDVNWIKPEGKLNIIKIDQIRELIEYLSKSAQQGGYKVAVFESAEGLNHAAQNALLKSLEEPGANSLLVLQTTHPHLLLPTIKSRCQTLTLRNNKQQEQNKAADFIDALSVDFNALNVAQKFKDEPLELLFNAWYEFLYEIIKFQQGLHVDPKWHNWRMNIETSAQKPTARIYRFIDELVALKALLHRKVALNTQALLERALIEWQMI